MTVQTKTKIKRCVLYGIILLAAHILQNSPTAFLPEILSVRPSLLISLSVCIAMFEGEVVGAVAGFFAGAFWDTVTTSADGYNAFYLMLACAVCGVLVRIFMQNNIITYIMLGTAVTMLYFSSYVLFFITAQGVDGGGQMLLRYYIPMAIYSILLMPVCYLLIKAVNNKFSYDYTEY